MKRFLYSVLVVLLCASCDSLLDLEPKNGVTFEHYFTTEQDLEAVVIQMHGNLRTALTGVTQHEFMGLRVDVVRQGSDMNKIRGLNTDYLLNVTNQQQWKTYYNTLAIVDLFFDNYQKAKNVAPERVRFYCGQGEFVKAMCYFYLVRMWGDAVITKGSNYIDKYAKSPASVVLDTAIHAALRAYDMLPKFSGLKNSNNKALTSKQYGCKGSAAALLAHLYAWKAHVVGGQEDLKEAEKWASKLIEEKYRDEVGVYTLAENPEEVCAEVMHRKSAESIFELEINYQDASTYSAFLPAYSMIGAPIVKTEEKMDIKDKDFGITIAGVNSLFPAGDARREAYFYHLDDPEWQEAGLAYLYKWRYARYGASVAGEVWLKGMDVNRVIFRLADMYLLRAECRVKMNDRAGAEADLKVIRQRANAEMWPAENDSGDLQYDIFKEREKELLYEGHRYYDVVRNGYWKTELQGGFNDLSVEDVKDGALYLPVPQTAFSQNDLMIQNTFWASKMK
ncbi:MULTISPECIES: RagB/SusD family nutrient uptake outer membrane protein [Butyricimonas]|uniref:RagB/SusD family nutrient uptake outer membrane protein n=1 Tax=Butyricimonas TaxID=574697 RepID=UPI001D05E8A0|nr:MULTISPECIES: RagB/SusD family nutrient uptake outer membrane protein [Butyricimonas]MCB6972047.1 RagB/SusD family nutrient uptake outer membrane protein [Butyricimonas synergistica]MCG4519055.1 RagB/SusD family nutrient uptake outer membrane protein [Butyricimonas sp. DFI.6.44]